MTSGLTAVTPRSGKPGCAPMRLLVISNMWPSEASPVFGSFIARQAKCLREVGAEVTVVANTDNRRGSLHSALKYASLSWRARRAALSGSFDAVVGHFLYPTAAFALEAARRADAPLVLVSHGTDSRSVMREDRFARRSREALTAAALVVAVSGALRDTLRETVGVPTSVPIAVVNMGFDDTVFKPDSGARDKLDLGESERVVLFVGNFEPVKGIDILLDAFVRLLDKGAADRLVLVGAGSLESFICERIADLAGDGAHADLSGRVTLTGVLGQRDLARWMAATDVLVLPSRNEGLGVVLLEAMASGTPCVASRVGGTPEVLDDTCGRLTPAEDPAALAEAIHEVLVLGKDTFREACIARAAEHTSFAKAVEFLEYIEKVVGRRGSQG